FFVSELRDVVVQFLEFFIRTPALLGSHTNLLFEGTCCSPCSEDCFTCSPAVQKIAVVQKIIALRATETVAYNSTAAPEGVSPKTLRPEAPHPKSARQEDARQGDA
ncbi:MAG: hypothetical protein LBR82_02135, partial [Desulfovibrio sp.]|nr:hypothetical protein [Desulfovibrio sp.]